MQEKSVQIHPLFSEMKSEWSYAHETTEDTGQYDEWRLFWTFSRVLKHSASPFE